MKTKIYKRLYALLAVAFMVLSFFFGSVMYRAKAATSAENKKLKDYASTTIIEDLKNFNISNYPKDSNGKPQVMAFMEYGYTAYEFYKGYYGLYIYVYNPTELPISEKGNKINIAVDYNEKDEPSDYENVDLVLLDATADVYNNRFFKFTLTESWNSTFYDNYKGLDERRYDIAGIQLAYQNASVKMDYTYGKTYRFTGYSKGLAEESQQDSTLQSTVDSLETIQLEVEHTNYRTGDYQNNVCDELNTVYFSVPDEYFAKYGERLQKIEATWEEYKTSPIFVTNEQAAADALEQYAGKDIGNREDALNYRVLWERYIDRIDVNLSLTYYTYRNAYNRLTGGSYTPDYDGLLDAWLEPEREHWDDTNDDGEVINDLNRLAWIFYRADAVLDGSGVKPNDWVVTGNELLNYMYDFSSKTAGYGVNTITDRGFSQYLFTDSIDEDRIKLLDENRDNDNETATRGRITQEIDAGDDGKLLFQKDQNFWEKIFKDVEYKGEAYSPIVVFHDLSELSKYTAQSFAEEYYINKNDAEKVFQYCKDAIAAGGNPVLFRFAQTDYYASNAYFDAESNKAFTSCDGFVAQETVFLGFEIIDLTFQDRQGVQTVIPVVSDPIDIVNDVTPPPDIPVEDEKVTLPDWFGGTSPLGGCGDGLSWDSIVSFVVSLVLVLVVGLILIILLPWVLKFIVWLFSTAIKILVWIIKAPFIFIAWLFKTIKSSTGKNDDGGGKR